MEWVVWCEAKEVSVDVAVDCDGCFGVFCEDFVNRCLEIFVECWVPNGSAVDVDDGVDWVGSLFSVMDLDNDGCCLGDLYVGNYGGEKVGVVVYTDISFVFMFVAFELVTVRIDSVPVEIVVAESDDVWWMGEEFDVVFDEEVVSW